MSGTVWRPMQPSELDVVTIIADAVHANHPESRQVFAERLALFPAGCLVTDGGYAIAHPTRLGEPPALDRLLGALDPAADTLHIHDVALQPAVRGRGLGGTVLKTFTGIAVRHGLAWLSLVAVNGTPPYWARFGFHVAPASDALASYGADARYMVRAALA